MPTASYFLSSAQKVSKKVKAWRIAPPATPTHRTAFFGKFQMMQQVIRRWQYAAVDIFASEVLY